MPLSASLPTVPSSPRVTAATALISYVAVTIGCSGSTAESALPQPVSLPTKEAAVMVIQPRHWPMIVRSQGTLGADEVALVGTKVAGRVSEVHVDLGDLVRAGDPLVVLDEEEFRLQAEHAEAQLLQARSALGLNPDDAVERLEPRNSPPVRQERARWDEAKANLERAERLFAQNVITQAEFDQVAAAERVAEARYASALNAVHEKIALIGVRQVELSLARDRLREAIIRSPFDGLIQHRQVAPGTYLQAGQTIVTLVRTNPLRFRGTVPERHAQNLAIGQQVQLRIESVAEPRTVQITRISPALDQRSRSLLFEAEVDNRDQALRTGLFAEAEVVIDPEAMALIAPYSSVVEFAGSEKVWKVVDGVAGEQQVLTGQRRPEGIEILSGLELGDMVLHDGSQGSVAVIKPLRGRTEFDLLEQAEELTGKENELSPEPEVASAVSG